MKQVVLSVGIVLGLGLGVSAQTGPPPDMVLLNGQVFTADAAHPTAQALAIRGERIVAVGTTAEITRLAGPGTRRIDVRGRVVTPGFNDAHNHFGAWPAGVQLQFKTMEPTWAETQDAIREAVRKAPPGTWIFGSVGATVVLDTLVNRAALDGLAPNHPVLLSAYYGHLRIINGKAMPLLRIGAEQPDPLGGTFERVRGTRQINGRLREYAEWESDKLLLAQVPDSAVIRELRQLAAQAAGFGITTVQLFTTMPMARFARLAQQADLPLRVHARPFGTTTARGRETTEQRQLSKLPSYGPKVRVSGLKWVLDATPYERGAALRYDYLDQPGWRGQLNFSAAEVAKMVQEGLSWQQPLLFHCAGDRSAELVLSTLESYGTKVSWPAQRVRIEHGDGVIEDLLPRAKKLGVVVVQNPAHFTEPALFHRRWKTTMQPLRSLLTAGVPLALGSDGPLNPFLNIMLASLAPSNPAEAITRQQAVQAYTTGSAFAEFAEKDKGTIAVGKLADVAVLSQDIFVVPPPELPRTTSVLTILGGKVVHDAGALK
ncbi:amidohydrolase [Hymenobacter aquaticus]|uniref:Amidohydrolase n=1 Tax=Hymenobacter aquaticus TaxID=1867101 RepID=A0A4Z0PW58_9BACT|nr:amidohydrolase [Hymenobacter aquaticus]TGE21715.1 amidohydrolase [Hymenobacter aquaticus]